MRRRQHHGDRHPVLEYLVFGLAALLALILLYWGGSKLAGSRWSSPVSASQTIMRAPNQPWPEKNELDVTATEHGVTRAPPVKISKLARRNKKTVVPLPK